MFYAEAINGQVIESSRNSTDKASAGQGRNLSVKNIERKIPIQPLKVSIVGRTIYAAPIDVLIRSVYEVKGDIEFTPEENKIYTVRGVLGEKYSAVWIEEGADKKVVGEKIEINGSAKLGVLNK